MPVLPRGGRETTAPARNRSKGYALAILAAACWATGGLTAKWLFTPSASVPSGWRVNPFGIEIDPSALSGGRALSAFLLLGAFLLATRRSELRARPRDLPFLAVFGIVGLAAVHYSYFKTISLTNVATAILLEYLAPIIVLVVSVAILGERLTWALPTGVALSVTGCALVVGALNGGGLEVSAEGIVWGLLSAAFFASYSLMGTYAAGRFSPWKLLFWGLGFASLFWLLVLGPQAVLRVFSTPATALAVIYVAVMSTIVPFGAFLQALHYIEPTRATVTATLEPVLAGLGAFVLFGETLTVTQLLGGALVILAIFVVQSSGEVPESLPPQD